MIRLFSMIRLSIAVLLLCMAAGTVVSCSSSREQASVKKSVKKTPPKGTKKKSSPSKSSVQSASKPKKTLLESYASQMNVSVSKLKLQKLYAVIDQWMGVPYKYAGNTQKGVDCSGFVAQVYRVFTSKPLPRSSSELAKVVVTKPVAKLQEGDLVFFNYDGKNSHVGIYLQNGWFVHASTVKGVVLSDLNASYYKVKFSKGGPLKIGSLDDFVK